MPQGRGKLVYGQESLKRRGIIESVRREAKTQHQDLTSQSSKVTGHSKRCGQSYISADKVCHK